MTSTSPLTPLPTGSRPVSRTALLQAARLGAAAAHADVGGDAAAGAAAFASWRRLRRRAGRQSRQLLRVAFDTGYGQAMSAPALAVTRQ